MLQQCYKINTAVLWVWGFSISLVEDSILLWCDTATWGKYFQKYLRNVRIQLPCESIIPQKNAVLQEALQTEGCSDKVYNEHALGFLYWYLSRTAWIVQYGYPTIFSHSPCHNYSFCCIIQWALLLPVDEVHILYFQPPWHECIQLSIFKFVAAKSLLQCWKQVTAGDKLLL